MALYLNTNISVLKALSNLSNATNNLNTTYQRLSSGLRINSAKDDAAGLQISNRLSSQINGLNQGNRNANDGIALAQTAEGAMDEMTTMLQRIRTLAIQSANGTNTTADRKALQDEVVQLSDEITRISCKTTFGGAQILAGANKGLVDKNGLISIQVGSDANDTIKIALKNSFSIDSMALLIGNNAQNIITDFISPTGDNVKAFRISTANNAQNTIENIDAFIQVVDSKRSELGAIQSRFDSIIRNQSNIITNLSDARSRIRDTDFAQESANLTQQSIMQQSAMSILIHATSRQSLILSLLN